MRLLLDTHAVLWFLGDDPRLSAGARSHLEDGSTDLLVSVASLWEVAIKLSIGRLEIDGGLEAIVSDGLDTSGIAVLDIEPQHLVAIASLPFHHRDPFDRMLIAQALTEALPIVSRDEVIDTYGVTRIW